MHEVARHMETEPYYFVFLGANNVVDGDLSINQIKRYFKQYPLSNCFCHFEFIPDSEFWSALQTFDLI